MDNEKLAALVTAHTEAQAQTMIAWTKVADIKPKLAAAEDAWKAAQEAENGTKKVLDDYLRDATKADAKEIKREWDRD